MGKTKVRLKVCNPFDTRLCRSYDAVVDTGSTYTDVPAEIARQIRLIPLEYRRAPISIAHVEVNGISGIEIVTIGAAEPPNPPAFGLQGMETKGLEVDPVTRRLKRSPAFPRV